MKQIVLLLCLSLGIAQAEIVCSVHDGDTFTLCNDQKVRIWGIDSPELKQPMGKNARTYLQSIILNKDVKIEKRGKSYKRVVALVELHQQAASIDIGRDMVRHGMAFDSAKYSKGYYADAEWEAQAKHLGVWRMADGGERPWDWRKKSH